MRAFILAVLVVPIMAVGCGSNTDDAQRQSDSPSPPLAALMYLWFGFDLTTGASIGGLKSSHWNTDLGTYGSRVGITDEPTYGFYSSDDPAVISRQLNDMETAGIDTILVSWHGQGDTNFDLTADDKEKEAMQRALIALMDYISTSNAPFKVMVLVEPFMVDPSGMTLGNKQTILDFLWDNVYSVYPTLMFNWEGKRWWLPGRMWT